MERPLADRLRPERLDDVVGQRHLIGPEKPFTRILATGRVPSMILWGPPGVGKTTLARIVARGTRRRFFELSAVAATKDDVRKIVEPLRAAKKGEGGLFSEGQDVGAPPPILFLDEIHRFNKAQQDYLLPFVEDGTIVLIGATTENPSFEVIPALLSRCRVVVLKPLEPEEEVELVRRGAEAIGAMFDVERLELVARLSGGDGRRALGLLEGAVALYGTEATAEEIRAAAQDPRVGHDKSGDLHYDLISALIKSMRASDADAAVYYVARLVEGGEDPLFVARRMVIFASEDVGLADPLMLPLANAVFQACHQVGYPEAAIPLAHGAAALARAPKNREAYDALRAAQAEVRESGALAIPLLLRNAPTGLMKELGYGEGYEMYGEAERLPERLAGRRFFAENPVIEPE